MKPIETLLIFFVTLFSAVPMVAASNLPECPSDETLYRDNCFGTYTFASGDKYVGEYRDGERNGQGTFTFHSGDKYVGEYRDGERNGQGTYTYADGKKDVGSYKNGALHGYAVRYDPDGTILIQGIWKLGEFQYVQISP